MTFGLEGGQEVPSVDSSARGALTRAMIGGNVHIKIHTEENPAGEIRGQVELRGHRVLEETLARVEGRSRCRHCARRADLHGPQIRRSSASRVACA